MIMKKIFVVLFALLCGYALQAQTSFGVKASVGIANNSGAGAKQADMGMAFKAGGTVRHLFGNLGTSSCQILLQGDLLMRAYTGAANINYNTESIPQKDPRTSYRLWSAALPVTAGVRFGFSDNIALSVRGGLYADYGLCGNVVLHNSAHLYTTDAPYSYNPYGRPMNKGSEWKDVYVTATSDGKLAIASVAPVPMDKFSWGWLAAVDCELNRNVAINLECSKAARNIFTAAFSSNNPGVKSYAPLLLTLGATYTF